jgi:hypothetical protein
MLLRIKRAVRLRHPPQTAAIPVGQLYGYTIVCVMFADMSDIYVEMS